jgi:arylsulfatase A
MQLMKNNIQAWCQGAKSMGRLRIRGRVLLGLAAILFAGPPAVEAAEKPNIIYIIADDLGYGDLGSYGQRLIRTPRLDRMAAEGMRFTQHYAGSSSCAPSRSVLMTGLHTGHTRVRSNVGGRANPLRPEDTVFVELLKAAGYATGGFGKWSLGDVGSTGAPWEKGFDLFFGYLDQTKAHKYYPEFLMRNDEQVEIPENRGGRRGVYSHDLIMDETLQFVRKHRERPFFAYVPVAIPHAELLVPEDSLVEYAGKWPEPKAFPGSGAYAAQDQPRAVRAAMITRLDRDVGRVLDLLDELKIAEKTLVIFTSDNGAASAGGADPDFFNSSGPLRGRKFSFYEGGIRVPFIARWPGRISRGSESPLVSDFCDMFPTFVELAGARPVTGLDGVSIVPTLLGRPSAQAPRQVFYWEHLGEQAVRRGDWKARRAAPDRAVELYNLAEDIGEKRDLAQMHPTILAELTALLSSSRVDSEAFPNRPPAKRK